MKKRVFVVAAAVVLVFGMVWAWVVRAQEPGWDSKSCELGNISAIGIFPFEPQRILLGSSGKIILRETDQQSWRVVLFLKGNGLSVHSFVFDPRNNARVFAATSDGFWVSDNAGKNWTRIYKGENARQNNCLAALVLPNQVMVGTSEGIFRSFDAGRTWQRESGAMARAAIVALGLNEVSRTIYGVTENEIYSFSMEQQVWGKSFTLSTKGELPDREEGEEIPQDNEEALNRFTSLAIDPFLKSRVVAGTQKGLIESLDNGLTWNLMSEEGLLDRSVTALLFARGSLLYCATGRRLYQSIDSHWQEIPLNSAGAWIAGLSLGKQGELFVATDKGLFQADVNQPDLANPRSAISEYCKKEPSIQQVQRAAVQYAEVAPEKIIRWRSLAASRAILPKVSASIGRDTTDLWHWESGSTTKTNDDVLMRGRDSLDWSVSLSWDLGELVWADAQTSIDVRSKLMVELRDSVLDEVTKIYFERIRVKAELEHCAIEDRKKIFEKELKLEELTASLDALTGQFFSNALGKK